MLFVELLPIGYFCKSLHSSPDRTCLEYLICSIIIFQINTTACYLLTTFSFCWLSCVLECHCFYSENCGLLLHQYPTFPLKKKANSKIHNLYSTQMRADKHMSEIIPLTTFQSIPTVYRNWNKNNCVKCQWMWHLPCLTATLRSQKQYVMKEVLWLEAFNCKLSQL